MIRVQTGATFKSFSSLAPSLYTNIMKPRFRILLESSNLLRGRSLLRSLMNGISLQGIDITNRLEIYFCVYLPVLLMNIISADIVLDPCCLLYVKRGLSHQGRNAD
jgi:hypothetical protein